MRGLFYFVKKYFGKVLSRNHCYATLEFLRKILKIANSELSEKLYFLMPRNDGKRILSEVFDFDGCQGATVRR